MPQDIEELKVTAPVPESRIWYKKIYDSIYHRIENPEKVHRNQIG